MNVIFCEPGLTMTELKSATDFFQTCRGILDSYVTNVHYISTIFQVDQLLAQGAGKDDIFVFLLLKKGNTRRKY